MTTDGEATPPARAATGLERWQPVLVVLVALVLATAVALVLAQSAGAIHLPFLGGTGGGQVGVSLPRG